MMSNKKFIQWFNLQKKKQQISCKIKYLKDLKYWLINDNLIHHSSGKFFKIVGIDVKSNTRGKNWDQPIIVQNEQGILGIIRNKFFY